MRNGDPESPEGHREGQRAEGLAGDTHTSQILYTTPTLPRWDLVLWGAECHIFKGLLGAPRPSRQGLPWDPHLSDPRRSSRVRLQASLGFSRDWKREGKWMQRRDVLHPSAATATWVLSRGPQGFPLGGSTGTGSLQFNFLTF